MQNSLLPLRLTPGQELRSALEEMLAAHGANAAFVLQGIGSLSVAQLRLAGAEEPIELCGDMEILTLAGSLSSDSAHLHMSVADGQGRVIGGHVSAGCVVRTTAEILVALLPDYLFARKHDAATGFAELVISPQKYTQKYE